MKKNKIAFLMDSPFTFGGEQRVVSKIANLFVVKGYNVSIICTRYNNQITDIFNLNKKVNIINVSPNTKIDNFIFRINNKLRKINSKHKFLPDFLIKKLMLTNKIRKNIFKIFDINNFDYIIGVAGMYSFFLSTYRSQINKKSKIIGWQHSNFDAYFNKKGRRMYNEKAMFKRYAKNFDKYVVLMDSDKERMNSFFDMDCIKIFNPLSFENVKKSTLNYKKFICLGRIEPTKGIDLLLKSYKKYNDLGGNWKLDIVGDGSQKDKMIKMAHDLNIDNYVKFIGFTNNVQQYFAKSTISLFPSRWEGFGLTLTESMQFGLPTICYKLPSFEEITKGFNSCVLVPTFDIEFFAKEMYRLSSNFDAIKKMSSEAISNTKIFEGETIINEWIKVFEEIGGNNEN